MSNSHNQFLEIYERKIMNPNNFFRNLDDNDNEDINSYIDTYLLDK